MLGGRIVVQVRYLHLKDLTGVHGQLRAPLLLQAIPRPILPKAIRPKGITPAPPITPLHDKRTSSLQSLPCPLDRRIKRRITVTTGSLLGLHMLPLSLSRHLCKPDIRVLLSLRLPRGRRHKVLLFLVAPEPRPSRHLCRLSLDLRHHYQWSYNQAMTLQTR